MARILIYGDSNSWGYPPDGSGKRMARQTRWPGVLAPALGAEIIEETLPGRTVSKNDPEMLDVGQNGRALLPAILQSHGAIDLVLIMLGTNDLKTRFDQSGADIAVALGDLVDLALSIGGADGVWDSETPHRIGVIAPPALGTGVDDPGWERVSEWAGATQKARDLDQALIGVMLSRGIPLFHAATVAKGAETDPIHLDAANQKALGRAVARWVRESFSEVLE
jgi:lysophospholipase L1-like esterase